MLFAGHTRQAHKQRSIVGQIVVVVIGAQLLFTGSLTAISLPTARQKNISLYLNEQAAASSKIVSAYMKKELPASCPQKSQARLSLYVPILPLAVFLGYTLGSTLGFASAALYLAAGQVFPYFGIYPLAAGPGADYYLQPGFGYLLGMLAAAWVAGALGLKHRTSLRQILASAGGVAAGHLTGLAYLAGFCLLSFCLDGVSTPQWRPWVFQEARNLSWYPLPYDFLFSIVLIALAFPFRFLVKTLTAADLNAKPKQAVSNLDLV